MEPVTQTPGEMIESLGTQDKKAIFAKLDGALKSALSIPEAELLLSKNDVKPAVDLANLVGTENVDEAKESLMKYRDRTAKKLLLGFGEHILHLQADINQKSWNIIDIQYNGEHSLGLAFEFQRGWLSNTTKIKYSNGYNPEELRKIFQVLTGVDDPGRFEEASDEREIFLSDHYQNLPGLIDAITSSRPVDILEGRMVTADEVKSWVNDLKIIESKGGVYEVGESKEEIQVKKNERFITKSNPEGYFLQSSNEIQTRSFFPVPFADSNGTIVGYMLYTHIENYNPKFPNIKDSVSVTTGSSLFSSVRKFIGNELESSILERKIVNDVQTQLEHFYESHDNTLNFDFSGIQDEYIREDLKNEFEQLIKLRNNQAYNLLARSFENRLRRNDSVTSNNAYLTSFLGDYLAMKVYTGKASEESIIKKIDNNELTYFNDFGNLLKNIIRLRGYQKMLG